MGIGQTRFFTPIKENSGVAVGIFGPPRSKSQPQSKKSSNARRQINPSDQRSKGEKIPKPSNPLTFGLLDY
jgi:hypothetical protein